MKPDLNTPAVVRVVIYIVGALAGLAAVVLPAFGVADYTGLLTAVAGAAATVTGGTAAYNIEKGKNSPVNVAELLAALRGVAVEAQSLRVSDPALQPDAVAPQKPEVKPAHPAGDGFSVFIN